MGFVLLVGLNAREIGKKRKKDNQWVSWKKKKSFRREEKVVCSPRWVPKILIYLQQCQ